MNGMDIIAATALLETSRGPKPMHQHHSLVWGEAQNVNSEPDNDMDVEAIEGSAGQGVRSGARSSDSHARLGGAVTKHTKHRAAEQRRRERINER